MGARRGRPTVSVELAGEERETLERWARRPSSSQALALRWRIVSAAAEGRYNKEIAGALGCHPATVAKWRSRFAERRLDGLCDEPRPGAPRTIGDAKVSEVIVRTLESAPVGATHWSTRSMAAAVGVSRSSVHAIWRALGLKAHLVEEFKLSPDPQFIDNVRGVVGLYLNPPEAAVVLCVDEKTQVQALDRAAPVLPLMPGAAQRRTHDYRRHGTTDLYAALEAASGKVISTMTARRRSEEFRRFLNLIDKEVPDHLDVHIILATSPPTRAPPSGAGWSATPASASTSPPPTAPVRIPQRRGCRGARQIRGQRLGRGRSTRAESSRCRRQAESGCHRPLRPVWCICWRVPNAGLPARGGSGRAPW